MNLFNVLFLRKNESKNVNSLLACFKLFKCILRDLHKPSLVFKNSKSANYKIYSFVKSNIKNDKDYLIKSEKFGIPPVVIPRQLEPGDKKAFEEFFLDIHNHQEGRQAITELGIEKFVTPDLSLYNF